MTQQLAAWHAEHVNFARLLDLLEAQVAAFHRGERPNYDLMGDILYYLQHFADGVHHRREDTAFARLAEREPRLKLVIDRLLQEHRVIATAGTELLRRLEEATGDVMLPRAALEAAAATYVIYYRNHLDTEEREVMPRAAALLTPEDWAAVEASVHPAPDPLFGDTVEVRFQGLRKQIAMESKLSRHA